LSSGEDLIGATVVIDSIGSGTVTNSYGFYSLSLDAGKYIVRYTFVGYQEMIVEMDLQSNNRLNIGLKEKSYQLGNIEVRGKRPDRNVTSIEMGNVQIDPKQIEEIPMLFGERDVLKTIQLTPGVKSAGEGNTGYYVRGGGIDQNLILLDEALVYNSSHLLGFFSVFNSDAIKNASLMKGAIPARFGGRASSVFDIVMKDGNMKEYKASGNVGVISSGLTVEGPIKKDKSSFIVSGRRTYADMFLFFSRDQDLKKTKLYFYDINAKANYKLNDNNRLYLSGYFGRDNFRFSDQFGFNWGSITGTLRWNHIFNEKLFSNTSFIVSNYSYEINILGDLDILIQSKIRDWNLKQDYSFYPNSKNTVRFGWNVTYHNILPGKISSESGESQFNNFEIKRRRALESALYLSN
jgi:hypothetical protein